MSRYDVMMLTESLEKRGRAVENGKNQRDFQESQYGDHHGEVSERRHSDVKESICLVFKVVSLEEHLSGSHLGAVSNLEVELCCWGWAWTKDQGEEHMELKDVAVFN